MVTEEQLHQVKLAAFVDELQKITSQSQEKTSTVKMASFAESLAKIASDNGDEVMFKVALSLMTPEHIEMLKQAGLFDKMLKGVGSVAGKARGAIGELGAGGAAKRMAAAGAAHDASAAASAAAAARGGEQATKKLIGNAPVPKLAPIDAMKPTAPISTSMAKMNPTHPSLHPTMNPSVNAPVPMAAPNPVHPAAHPSMRGAGAESAFRQGNMQPRPHAVPGPVADPEAAFRAQFQGPPRRATSPLQQVAA